MTQQELIVKQRRQLLIFAQRLGVKQACRTFGLSRTTFYKIKEQLVKTGSLSPRLRGDPRMPNETVLSKKKLILRLVQQQPSWGPDRIAYQIRQQGIYMTGVCVWRCLKRFGLNRRYQRLVYLEQLKEAGQPVTERNLKVLKKKFTRIKHGLWPGHLVALDTFCVGHLKGVGRVYQVTGIDLCSRYGWAKVYGNKDQKATGEFLETCLLPRLYGNKVAIERVLTDNGTEFTASSFRQLLADYRIKHERIPKGKPMLNGYCERFQRTIFEEFYQRVFRTTFFTSISQLNQELEKYLYDYNFNRAHFGLDPKGAKPIDVLNSKLKILRHRFQKLST